MNTKIADFVSKRTDPYFFSPQEDANLTAIHTEVKRSIESATDELTFDLDPLLMAQAEEVLAEKGGRWKRLRFCFSTGWPCRRRMQKRGMINLAGRWSLISMNGSTK
jgi:hypothetical protein